MRDIADIIVDYQQADEDGVMVLVSRQACDEAKAEIQRLRGERDRLTVALEKQDKRIAELEALLRAATAEDNPPRTPQAVNKIAELEAALRELAGICGVRSAGWEIAQAALPDCSTGGPR